MSKWRAFMTAHLRQTVSEDIISPVDYSLRSISVPKSWSAYDCHGWKIIPHWRSYPWRSRFTGFSLLSYCGSKLFVFEDVAQFRVKYSHENLWVILHGSIVMHYFRLSLAAWPPPLASSDGTEANLPPMSQCHGRGSVNMINASGYISSSSIFFIIVQTSWLSGCNTMQTSGWKQRVLSRSCLNLQITWLDNHWSRRFYCTTGAEQWKRIYWRGPLCVVGGSRSHLGSEMGIHVFC